MYKVIKYNADTIPKFETGPQLLCNKNMVRKTSGNKIRHSI